MNPSPEFLEQLRMEELESLNNVKKNYKEGTILLVSTNFDTNKASLNIEKVEILNLEQKMNNICWAANECFVINCFENINYNSFSNEFIFLKKEVEIGDNVYVVIADDGDLYGQFILGIFTEKPNEDEIIKKYNDFLDNLNVKTLNNYHNEFYINNIYEIKIS